MDIKNEIDLAKFNNEFEENDIKNNKYQEKPIIYQEKLSPKLNQIEKIILAMRIVFEIILDKSIKGINPIPEIFDKDELVVGFIALCFFIGGLTLILGGIMKE